MPRRIYGRAAFGIFGAVGIAAACSTFESAGTEAPADGGASDATGQGEAAGGDGSGDVGADVDAGAARCAIGGPFASLRKVDGVNTPEEESVPRLSHDERVIYFRRAGPATGSGTFYRGERAKIADAFGSLTAVEGVPAGSAWPFVTPDELTIYYGALASPTPALVATRDAATQPFRTATNWFVAGVSPDTAVFVEDGKEVFYSESGGVAGEDLWSAYVVDGGFADAAALGTLSSTVNDEEPVISADGLELFFYSERMRGSNVGTIYVSSRDSRGSPWRTPAKVAELEPESGAQFASPGTISPDHCRLYYYASTDPSAGWDLYVAERAVQ